MRRVFLLPLLLLLLVLLSLLLLVLLLLSLLFMFCYILLYIFKLFYLLISTSRRWNLGKTPWGPGPSFQDLQQDIESNPCEDPEDLVEIWSKRSFFRAGLSIGILKFDGNVSRRAYFWQQKSWPPVKLPLKFMLKSPGRSFTRTAWRMLGEEVTWNRYTRYISWHKVGFTLWPLNPSDCLIGLWENGLDSKFPPPQKREKTHWWFTMV